MSAPTAATATQAQLEAGNYRKPKRRFQGLLISIENRKGSVRSGVDPNGHEWRTKMHCDYGYIRGSLGVDGDQVDCYVGPDKDADTAYVVHQRKAGKWTEFDEDKVMLGFTSEDAAKSAYLKQYDDPRFLGPITAMPMDEFKRKVLATFDRPKMIKAILFFKAKNPRLAQHISDLFAEQVRVEAHTDKTGRFVPEHTTTVHKRHEKPKAAKPKAAADDGPVQGDLFAEPAFAPTHELSDGTPVRATGEPHVYIDADGAEYEDLYAKPIARHRRAEKPTAPVVQGRKSGEAAGVAAAGAEAGADAQAAAVPGGAAGELAGAAGGAAEESDWRQSSLDTNSDIASRKASDNWVRVTENPSAASNAELNGAWIWGKRRLYYERAAEWMRGVPVRQAVVQALESDVSMLRAEMESRGLIDPKKPDAPQEGERNAEGLVFHDGRWHREEVPVDAPTFGIPETATKKQRKAWNAEALRVLDAHPEGEPWTDAEKASLARYSGQGGVGDSLNEYYTRNDVVGAMWSLLDAMGVDGGTILEPSCGTGAFLHQAPAGAQMVGVDLDATSSRIARILHGGEVYTQAAETFATEDPREFAAVVGNCPFGVRGALIKADKPHLPTCEQYFLDMAIDKCQAGGVVAMIVPTGIMQGMNTRAYRAALLRKGEFVDAYRLPNTAFAHSHTGVTADIVVFRAYPKELAGALSKVGDKTLERLGLWDEEFVKGGYFEGRGKDNVFGTPEAGWRAKAGMGNDFTVSGSMDGVAEAIGAMRPSARTAPPPDIATVLEAARVEGDDATEEQIKRAASARHYEVAKVGDIKEIDGILYCLEGVPPRWHRLSGQEVEKVAALDDAPRVVDALDLLSRYPDREDLRQEAREALERYVAAHGIPAENKALVAEAKRQRGAGAARDLYRLIGAVNPDGSFSDLVTGRQAEAAGATLDSVAERLALEHGGFTIEGLAQALAATDTEEIHDALYASDAYALEGDGRTWTTTAQYLTGNLWPKLDAARAMVDHGGLGDHARAKYERQIAALEAAIAPKLLDDVEIEMRSGWVPLDALQEWMESQRQDYLREHPEAESWFKPVEVSFAKGIFTVKGGLYHRELIEKYLNREGLRAERDKPVIDELNQQFRDWVLASDRREALEDAYNRAFRGYVKPKSSDAPLDIPGLNPEFKVNAYHYAGLRWAIEAGKGIIAADVGVGKTGRGLMLGALARAHGKAKKPTYVVPKSVLANWVVEADAWFPGSNVLVIGEEYERDASGKLVRNDKGELKSKSDSPEAKARKLAMLAQNNYDFVFISQPVWNEIDLDPISKGDLIENDFWVQRGDSLGNAGDKRLNQIRQNYAQAVAKRDFSERSGAAYFNDLGIDMLILDEAHAFKNLFSIRARWGDNPKFLGGGGLSNRAHDTDLKAAWFRAHNGNRGIYGLTATPTKNSPLEIYSMLHHFAPEAFEAIGIKNSEEFIDRFVTFEQDSILSTTGEIESALVCAGFKNLDELRPIMDRYIDRTTAADVGLKIPERDVREHWADMTDQQAALYAELREAAKPSDGGESEHIFRIIDRMSKAALDPSLLGHEAAESPKIAAAVAQMMEGAKEGGQVVFCDYLDAHERIRDELIAKGVDPKRIAICNAKVASSATARQGISDRFNAGKLDYVIGNTATMGEGMNLQKRTTDIHHLDLPWEPASLQQRNGRGLRQGNINEAVRIHTYFAKGSFDGYRWQTLTAKKDWQDLLWNGGDTVENLARQSGLSRLDMQILFSADPEAERAKLEGATAEALARKNAEEQAAAAGEFVRFQELKRSYSELKDKGSKSATALAQRIANEATRLRANRHFAHKAALDSDLPALIHPQTGELWQPGTALEMDGSSGQPYNWSSAPSKWVVTHVNPRDKTVTVRLWASNGKDGRQTTLGLDKLVHGYRQIPYVSEDEQAEILRAARVKELGTAVGTVSHLFPDPQKVNADVTQALADATEGVQDWHKKAQTRAAVHVAILDALSAAVDQDRAAAKEPTAATKVEAAAASIYRAALFGAYGLAKVDDLTDLRSVAPETLVSLGPDIQAHFRERADSYKSIMPGEYMPLIGPDGPHLAASYDARKRIQSGHDAMLPTEANLEAAIAAAVRMERTKTLRAEYRQARKNSQSKRVGTSAQYSQAGDAYGLYSAKTNPWRNVIEHVWGSEAAGRVDAAITRAWQEDMAKATDAAGALQAARTGLQHTPYGAMTSVPKDVAAALRAKLRELGALDTPANESRAFTQDSELRDVLGLSYYYPKDTVGQALGRKGI